MTRAQAIALANEYYQNLRREASLSLTQREAEVKSTCPDIRDLLIRRARLPISSLRASMANPGESRKIAERMKNEGIRLNADIRASLVRSGYSEDYLTIKYTCPVCQDTGYVKDSMPAKMCVCFERKLASLLGQSDGESPMHRFEDFDEDRIPREVLSEGLTQRDLTIRVRQACEDYADQYPDCYLPNLMLSGQAGLGKSFLMDAMAHRLSQRGFPVVKLSAYQLLEILRSKHLHMEDADEAFDELLTCPILMIDDLGNEPKIRNISEEYLCVVLEERLKNRRHTVITTNLNPAQLCEFYGERVMSRLCDKTLWDHLRLLGKDLRRS